MKMLEHSETMELIKKAKQGDEKAKTLLITCNAPLVKSIIKRYKNKGVEYDDLMQLGAVGFMKAIYNFDESFGVKFSTYAVPMIMGEVKRFMRDDGYIKVSRSVKQLYHKINQFINEQKAKGERHPTTSELAEKFLVSEQDIVYALDAGKMPISLFEKMDDSDEKSQNIMDRLVTCDNTDSVVDKIALKKVLGELKDREKKIIMLRYFRDKTQSEVAEYLGVSQVQVSRLETKILKTIREGLEECNKVTI